MPWCQWLPWFSGVRRVLDCLDLLGGLLHRCQSFCEDLPSCSIGGLRCAEFLRWLFWQPALRSGSNNLSMTTRRKSKNLLSTVTDASAKVDKQDSAAATEVNGAVDHVGENSPTRSQSDRVESAGAASFAETGTSTLHLGAFYFWLSLCSKKCRSISPRVLLFPLMKFFCCGCGPIFSNKLDLESTAPRPVGRWPHGKCRRNLEVPISQVVDASETSGCHGVSSLGIICCQADHAGIFSALTDQIIWLC